MSDVRLLYAVCFVFAECWALGCIAMTWLWKACSAACKGAGTLRQLTGLAGWLWLQHRAATCPTRAANPGLTCYAVTPAAAHLRRDGDDLIFTKRLSLAEALCGTDFSVVTLDNRSLNISTKEQIIQPGSQKVLR